MIDILPPTEDRPISEHSNSMDGERYRSIMRHQAGAVSVIATGEPGARAGLTATAVSSLSDDPPAILVCVGRRTGTHDVIHDMRVFSVNLLAGNQQAVADCFAGRTMLKGEDRFGGFEWGTLTTGAPILTGALASLDCKLSEAHTFSTHTIFIGQVVDGTFNADVDPLLYFRGDYWDLGRGERGGSDG